MVTYSSLLQNPIGNAIKYRGAELPLIHVALGREVGELRVTVPDNGVRDCPEYHKKIFVPFKRLHGRKMSVAGSTFVFTLPETAVVTHTAASERSNEHTAI
jgi:light-regulated signal transduction histidine kinase (bacteriophytochrome)